MSEKRVRLLKVILQVVAVIDDGEELTEAAMQPVEIKAADWPDVLATVATGLAQIEQQVNEA